MSSAFAALKNNRSSNLARLNAEIEKQNSKKNFKEDREGFWEPTVDKAGNGSAVLRFLPPPAGEELPFIRMYDHGFKGPGGWYIELSRTSINEPDPVAEHNKILWNSGRQDEARAQKRRMYFLSNVYVVKDPGNPSNEGKVFLWRYGKKVADKIAGMTNPEFEEDEAINPFDAWGGCNFRLRIKDVEGYRNYDSSDFAKPSPLADSDEEIEKIWNQCRSLQEFLKPENYKSYDELKAKLNRVLGIGGSSLDAAKTAMDKIAKEDAEEAPRPKSASAKKSAAKKEESPFHDNDLTDDDEELLRKLREED